MYQKATLESERLSRPAAGKLAWHRTVHSACHSNIALNRGSDASDKQTDRQARWQAGAKAYRHNHSLIG